MFILGRVHWKVTHATIYNNNNNNILCASILEDQAQWRDKTKGLSNLLIVSQYVSHRWMDEGARKLTRIGSIKEIDIYILQISTLLFWVEIFYVYLNYCAYVIIFSRHVRLLIGTTDPRLMSGLFSHGEAANDKEIKCSKRFRLGLSPPLVFRPPIHLFDFETDRLVVRTHNNIYFLYQINS